MIRKKDLIEALDALTIQQIKQGKAIRDLEEKVAALTSIKKQAPVKVAEKKTPAKKVGRPRKNVK